MPLEIDITVNDPKFFQALQDPEGFVPILSEHMKNIVDKFESLASVYAPESEANHPGRFSLITQRPMGYYERGRGWWYPLTTMRTLGGVGSLLEHSIKAPKTKSISSLKSVGILGVTGYRLRETSEQMNQRWTTDVTQDAGDVLGEISNTASYSGWVVGQEQAKLHAARDWKNVEAVADSSEMKNFVDDESAAALKEFFNI